MDIITKLWASAGPWWPNISPICRAVYPGIGLNGIQKKLFDLHQKAYDPTVIALPIGGIYKYRRGGESHALEGQLIHLLQHACDTDSYATFKKYSEAIGHAPPISVRDLLDFKEGLNSVPLDEVESINEIRKRFVTPGMSLGALSPEAHGTLNIAMNRIGAKSVSGEGRGGSGAVYAAAQWRQSRTRLSSKWPVAGLV